MNGPISARRAPGRMLQAPALRVLKMLQAALPGGVRATEIYDAIAKHEVSLNRKAGYQLIHNLRLLGYCERFVDETSGAWICITELGKAALSYRATHGYGSMPVSAERADSRRLADASRRHVCKVAEAGEWNSHIPSVMVGFSSGQIAIPLVARSVFEWCQERAV